MKIAVKETPILLTYYNVKDKTTISMNDIVDLGCCNILAMSDIFSPFLNRSTATFFKSGDIPFPPYDHQTLMKKRMIVSLNKLAWCM
jgi:hypothetical protein